METRRYGYARVSTKEQNLDRQIAQLTERDEAGNFKYLSSERELFMDKASGKDMNRPSWQSLMNQVRSGDEITVISLDRLSRNYDEIGQVFRELTEKGVKIRVLDMPMISTTDRNGDLTSKLISDITLSLLSYVAEQERAKIKERQAQGIAQRRAKGLEMGRPSLKVSDSWDSVVARYRAHEITSIEASKELGMSKASFFRLLKKESC